jgi:hypothetical protein
MAPTTTSWFQERPWGAPTKGLAWYQGDAVIRDAAEEDEVPGLDFGSRI